jgi:AraC-like DNA-binding protein
MAGVRILMGGYAECRPENWCRREWTLEPYAKVWIPVAGEAVYRSRTRTVRVLPDRFYFFTPHQVERHECREKLDCHWMHFTIDSPLLDQRFARLHAVEEWPVGAWSAWKPVYERMRELSGPYGEEFELRLQALALAILAEVSVRHPLPEGQDARMRERFAPALAFMDAEFRRNPPLAEVAAKAGLSAAHFHRAFTAAFRVSPHAYLLRRRMDLAQQLLARTGNAVRDIAAACGYDDQFYFSRVFKRWSRLSPEKYRASRSASP